MGTSDWICSRRFRTFHLKCSVQFQDFDSTISGIVFFASYAPEGMNPILYSLGYQASYLVPEAVITLIIISIPPVAKALARVKQNAVEA